MGATCTAIPGGSEGGCLAVKGLGFMVATGTAVPGGSVGRRFLGFCVSGCLGFRAVRCRANEGATCTAFLGGSWGGGVQEGLVCLAVQSLGL